MNKKAMKDIGERDFLQKIANLVDNPVLDFNDDASAIHISDDIILVINADMLVKKTDVLPGMSSNQIGRKAVTMSVSDIIAKGVKPIGCLASVAFPKDLEIETANAIIEGIKEQCAEYEAKYLGGDLNEGDDVIIDIVSFGTCSEKTLIPRVGVESGDILYTTGYFGLTQLGFMYTLQAKEISNKLKGIVLDSVYRPKAKIEYLSLLQTTDVKICMDSSDGLIITLTDLSKLNKMGIEISNVPIHPEIIAFVKKNDLNPLDCVFDGGEEFNLVFAISPENEQFLVEEAQKQNLLLIKLGYFTDGFEGIKITHDEYKGFNLSTKGYEHFK
jgi:thiamine-monophosphate kinase